MRFQVFVFLLVLFFAQIAVADNDLPAGPPTPAISATKELDEKFYRAILLVQEGKHAKAAEEFLALRRLGRARGYENFPAFSAELLKQVQVSQRSGRSREEQAFWVRSASELSFDDSRTQFTVAAHGQLIGRSEASAAFFRALRALPGSPSLMVAAALNTIIILLVAFTLSLMLVYLIQIARNSEAIFSLCANSLPFHWRGILTPVVMLLVLCLPILGGPLLLICCWGFLLSRAAGHCRFCLLAAAVLMLLWGVSIPVFSRVGASTQSKTIREVEGVAANGYLPGATAFLRAAVAAHPGVQMQRAIYGKALALDGEKSAALAEWKTVSSGEQSKELKAFVAANQALLSYRGANYADAHEQIESALKIGGKKFELLWNMALVQLGELNTASHRQLYEQARALDPARVQRIEAESDEQAAAIFVRLGFFSLAPLLFEPQAIASPADVARWESKENKLAASLFRGLSAPLMVAVGLLILANAFALKDAAPKTAMSPSSDLPPGFPWLLFPGGLFVAGGRPLLGSACLALVFAAFILALETPLSFLPVLDHHVFRAQSMMLYGLVLGILTSMLPVLWERFQLRLR